MSHDIELSIIIVSWNGRRDLEACLQSLRVNSEVPREIIVVDNASADDTLPMLDGHPEVNVIANPDNRGFAAANNQGLAVARGEWLLLLNPDTLVPPGALILVRRLKAAVPAPDARGGRAGGRRLKECYDAAWAPPTALLEKSMSSTR